MVNLTRYNPFDEMISLRDAMDRLFAESFISPRALRSFDRAAMIVSAGLALLGALVVTLLVPPGRLRRQLRSSPSLGRGRKRSGSPGHVNQRERIRVKKNADVQASHFGDERMPTTTNYDAVIIGAGQAGVPLSTTLAKAGWKTALVERVHV